MRPAVLFFAPLLLLPLACADTPAEPGAEVVAFKMNKPAPKEPGDYLHAEVRCREGWSGLVRVENPSCFGALDYWIDASCGNYLASTAGRYPWRQITEYCTDVDVWFWYVTPDGDYGTWFHEWSFPLDELPLEEETPYSYVRYLLEKVTVQ